MPKTWQLGAFLALFLALLSGLMYVSFQWTDEPIAIPPSFVLPAIVPSAIIGPPKGVVTGGRVAPSAQTASVVISPTAPTATTSLPLTNPNPQFMEVHQETTSVPVEQPATTPTPAPQTSSYDTKGVPEGVYITN